MDLIESIAIAASLCADCFAVSLCSGVTLGKARSRDILKVAIGFAVIQGALLLAGCLFGKSIAGLVETAAHILGFILLAYVGGSMLVEGIRGEQESRDLNGWRNILLGGIATSIDALAVGAARSIGGTISPTLPIAVFVITFISVVAGIKGGKAIGTSCGRWAEIAGGIILIAIGALILAHS